MTSRNYDKHLHLVELKMKQLLIIYWLEEKDNERENATTADNFIISTYTALYK